MPLHVKELLKKIFPLVLLRNVQLEVNKLRIRTIDKWLFPEQSFQQQDFLIRHDAYPFRLHPVPNAHLDGRLQQQIAKNYNWTQDEYLLVYEAPCIIDPQFGWALSQQNKLIYPSLGFSRVPYLPKPDTRIKEMWKSDLEEYDELISLRDTGEENYYHFYNDVLVKLLFLGEKLDLNPATPILISAKLYNRAFFQYFLQHPYLRDRQWIVQDQQYIRSKKTYFCKPLTHTPHYYQRILEMVKPEDRVGAGGERRIFITRSPKRLRYIENNAEVEAVCREFGFETVDFDLLSLPEQIRVMGQARYVVGIHGAGLTNMLFRSGHPMGLLEVYPPSIYFPFHYILMADQLGYQYDGLIGEVGTSKYSGGFYANPVELRQRIESLLQR
ncbi:glycosyltransferase family 61 protein [Hymenobacter terrestris]|uniref:Glycosyltransferase family 61 protein n=1 Tax=Hymenobacter terrestris TaxID=2748310 RepID=A0ABX2Q5U9_9BACT|nr:glycosyltransferase family 61 protein [Hymenobacter terrestris]NVO85929.1 glycosyltransferase family 61 protein [Hymenobacter terrestris]